MKPLQLLVATLILAMLFPGKAEAVARAACPSAGAAVAKAKPVALPQEAHFTHAQVSFDVDVGSDGRIRDIRLVETSGDSATDVLVQNAIKTWEFQPTRTGCVAASGIARTGLRLTESTPTPSEPIPTPISDQCTPLVDVFIAPNARDRSKRGSATVSVPIDAAGTRHGEPQITKATGSAVLDEEALRIARTAQYNFVPGTGCRPQATTYELELTFE